MRPILSAEELRRCDAAAVAAGVPSLRLMENAARGSLEVLAGLYGPLKGKRILVLAGIGNNGGDGIALARLARTKGAMVTIALLGVAGDLTADAGTNYRRAIKAKVNVKSRASSDLVEGHAWDVIVDALLGTGARLPLPQAMQDLVASANRHGAFRLSIDLPTGVTAAGELDRGAFHAHATATLAALKSGLLFGEGRLHAGSVHLVPIGWPDELLDPERSTTRMIQREDVVERFPTRLPSDNKYSVGKLLLLCGSPGMTGAATLSSMAAMRTGAGITTLAVPLSVARVAAVKLTETIILALPENDAGAVNDRRLEALSIPLTATDAFVVGCGVSKDGDAHATVRAAVAAARCPVVLDADGIGAFAEYRAELRAVHAPVIITPHAGELARLIDVDRQGVTDDPLHHARTAAADLNVIVVLKGGPTVIATPSGLAFINPTGNPGMATAGGGDVLAGMIGALLAQGCEPLNAAIAGVYLHGMAGDLAADRLSEPGLTAGDIMRCIPRALRILPVERTGTRFSLPR